MVVSIQVDPRGTSDVDGDGFVSIQNFREKDKVQQKLFSFI